MSYSLEGLNSWANGIRDTFLDVDYAPKNAPFQCHDVFLSYITTPMFKLSVGDGHAPGVEGWTSEVWLRFSGYRPNLAAKFDKIATRDILPGDVIFWSSYGGVGNLPHVAVALAPSQPNGTVFCVTQNPGKVKFAYLTTANVLGVLRPKGVRNEERTSPMFVPYWTGPTVNNTKVTGRIITEFGSFSVPNMQIMSLLERRYNASFVRGSDNDRMLDAEADILHNYLSTQYRSVASGVKFDVALFRSAVTDALKASGTNITYEYDTELDLETLNKVVEVAADRVNAKFIKTLGEKLAK